MSSPTKRLTDELSSLLDEATILSISSDYNLDDPEEFAAARHVLLTISKDVEAEEATGFNPSGIGLNQAVDIDATNQGTSAEPFHASGNDVKSSSGLTTPTENSHSKSLASGTSSKSSTYDESGSLHVNVFDGLSDEEKERQLASMFVSLKPIDIKLALQKCKSDASLAIDELLNLQLLEQTGQRPKGIDGFYVSDDDHTPKTKKGRKKKKKTKVQKSASPKTSESTDGLDEAPRDEEEDNRHIAFMCERLSIPTSEAASIFQRNKYSLGASVVEFLDNYISLGLQTSSPYQAATVRELAAKCSWVPQAYFDALLDVTSSDQDAADVVSVLANHFEKPAYLKYDVSYSLVAADLEGLSLDDDDDANTPGSSSATRTTMRPAVVELRRAAPPGPSAATLAASRNHSYTSAATAARRGRSDPLYRQAAGYYAARGREQAADFAVAHRREQQAAAEVLRVDSADAVDLHGLTVADGVAVARDRVRRWWDGLGPADERARRARGRGFGVVTGWGRHTADGRSRLRVHVFKALVADGWKLEVLTGSYLVTGRRR
ncbi:hypothetical protein F4780DRAFT_774369 [Xylariomycetidae sp. FL0641]|nr:hypothetical protein F4780DRAFT_774369 [Xylariomycetidae sp. FL0641]